MRRNGYKNRNTGVYITVYLFRRAKKHVCSVPKLEQDCSNTSLYHSMEWSVNYGVKF